MTEEGMTLRWDSGTSLYEAVRDTGKIETVFIHMHSDIQRTDIHRGQLGYLAEQDGLSHAVGF